MKTLLTILALATLTACAAPQPPFPAELHGQIEPVNVVKPNLGELP